MAKSLAIMVTGGDGFLGKNVIEVLGYKYKITGTTHKELDLLDGLAVDKFFKKNNFDVLVHFASVGGKRGRIDDVSVLDKNLRIFLNLVKNKKSFGKMVYTGSGAEYGKDQPIKMVSENEFGKRIPQDFYGLSKFVCAKITESEENVINLRLFGIFGKYEDVAIRFISNAICKSILEMPITINQNVFFDYLYVEDFIKILDYFLADRVRYKSYNVGSGRRIDLVTIANKINDIAKHKMPVKVKLRGLANEYTCDNKRLIREAGGFKFTDIDRSLVELYDWYLSRRGKLKKKDFINDHFN